MNEFDARGEAEREKGSRSNVFLGCV